MDVDDRGLLVAEKLVHDGDGDDPTDALAQLIGHFGVARAPRLQAQQRGNGLQVVLHPVVNLLDHGRLDSQLLLLLELVGDVLDGDDGPGRHRSSTDQSRWPAAVVAGDERHHALDPHQVLLLNTLLETHATFHRLEADVLVRFELLELGLDQVVGVAEASIEVLGRGAEVLDASGRVDDHHAVVDAKPTELATTTHATGDNQVAGACDGASERGVAFPLALVLDQQHLAA